MIDRNLVYLQLSDFGEEYSHIRRADDNTTLAKLWLNKALTGYPIRPGFC
jgi:hypothetical protein